VEVAQGAAWECIMVLSCMKKLCLEAAILKDITLVLI
jgi:hypothetical protein